MQMMADSEKLIWGVLYEPLYEPWVSFMNLTL